MRKNMRPRKSSRRSCQFFALAVFVALGASPLLARDPQVFYCSTTGSDDNPGTEGLPFKTPAYAIAQANTPGDEVRFVSGTYDIDSTIALGHQDITLTGTAARDVVFDAHDVCRILVSDAASQSYSGIVLSGITFRNGRYSEANDGWGLMKTLGGAVRLLGATSGGGYDTPASVVTNCAFENCSSAYGGGGGLCVGNGSTVVDCIFENCTSGLAGARTENQQLSPGGALCAFASGYDITVLRCSFTGNVCSNGVGAISSGGVSYTCDVVVRDCGFTNNISYGYAGCLGIMASTVENCIFNGNESRKTAMSGPRNSGGVFAPEQADSYLTTAQTIRYSNCTFDGNKSVAAVSSTGGGVFNVSKDVLVIATNCVFTGNVSAMCGSVYYGTPSAAGGLVMEDCVVKENHTDATGTGEVWGGRSTMYQNDYYKQGIMRLVRTKFIGNEDVGTAGVVYASAPETEIVDCEFRSNSVSRCGSAPATVIFHNAATNSILRGCLFAANTNNKGNSNVVRFGASTSGTTGGMNCTVESCTFAGNRWTGTSYSAAAGAINFLESTEGAIVRNCVFWDNRSSDKDNVQNFSTQKSCADIAQYCWEDGLQLVTGTRNNIAGGTMPKFADAANGDWTPTARSPWVNLGQNQSWMASAFDLRNDKHFPRLNGVVDMGCYEYSTTHPGMFIIVR